jgi:hypothetical protein
LIQALYYGVQLRVKGCDESINRNAKLGKQRLLITTPMQREFPQSKTCALDQEDGVVIEAVQTYEVEAQIKWMSILASAQVNRCNAFAARFALKFGPKECAATPLIPIADHA